MGGRFAWSCEDRPKAGKPCRNAYGCHCAEITAQCTRIKELEARLEAVRVEASELDVAAALWKADAIDSGTPASVARGRMIEAFADQSEMTRARWLKFARTAIRALARPRQDEEPKS